MTVVKLLDAHMPRPESGVDMLRLVFKSPDVCRHQPAYGVVMQYVAFRCKALPVVRKAVVVVKHTSCHKKQRNYFHCRRRLLLLSPCCRAVARRLSLGGFIPKVVLPVCCFIWLAMAVLPCHGFGYRVWRHAGGQPLCPMPAGNMQPCSEHIVAPPFVKCARAYLAYRLFVVLIPLKINVIRA